MNRRRTEAQRKVKEVHLVKYAHKRLTYLYKTLLHPKILFKRFTHLRDGQTGLDWNFFIALLSDSTISHSARAKFSVREHSAD